ncbi:TetR family transcriptional regulator [Iamia majanohamensis]|uniref:TetR family transcriptional regulator n=1 Tax=Iamia majanohamensis TaxID=467976 RepID=A0AAF0BUZ8_9ACTN|nr:TetR family transcriptional regulator [Iamia majanohamensis]WCO66265.1 TetR family transcriptional regulator [Iamia majanohamensis]
MRDRNPARRRILAAARKEFAAHGIAGARVDRIAVIAKANKALMYHYFESKDELFDAVFSTVVEEVVTGIPLDVYDLPGYAARLVEAYEEHPDLRRLATWHRLERSSDGPHEVACHNIRARVDTIAAAQREGRVSDRYPPDVTLMLVHHIATVWASAPAELDLAGAPTSWSRPGLVADAVERLLR